MEILPLATMFKFFYYPNFIFNWIQKKKKNKQTNETNCGDHRTVYFKRFSLFILFTWNIFVRSNGFQKKKVNQITLQYQSSCFECFLYWSFIVTLHHRNSSYDLDRRKFKPRAGRLKVSHKCTANECAGMNAP